MEPTVFCLVIPLAFNICSIPIDFDPFLHSIRQERSISVNTGDAAADGKIVNTAQTDKQLIINIETRLLPQFNVYLDSLQQQPKMQCTSNDGETNGKEKKRIFTCVAVSNLCCPSTMTCSCPDQPSASSSTVTDAPPNNPNNPPTETELVPGNPKCEELCAVCAEGEGSTALLIPGSPKCEDLCALCAERSSPTDLIPTTACPPSTTELIPTTTQCPQLLTTDMSPGSQQCDELCAICADKSTEAIVPGSQKCQDLCALCANTSPPTSLIPTTPPCPTPTTTDPTVGSQKCQELCALCIDTPPPSTALVPGSQRCQDLCAQCVDTPPPSTALVPGSQRCQDLCAQCVDTPPPSTALVPGSQRCQDLCALCVDTPPPPITTPESKCISCNTLCQMCVAPTTYERKKRALRYDYYNPIATNDNYYDAKQNKEYKPNFKSKFIGALMAGPHNHVASYRPRPLVYTNLSQECNLVPGSSQCQQLCIDCKDARPTVDPKSTECQQLCCYCKSKQPASVPLHPHLIPGSEECKKLCEDCIVVKPSPRPGSITCNSLCQKCTVMPIEPSTIKPDCNAVPDEPISTLKPKSEKCIELCSQCKQKIGPDTIKITRKNCTHSSKLNKLF